MDPAIRENRAISQRHLIAEADSGWRSCAAELAGCGT